MGKFCRIPSTLSRYNTRHPSKLSPSVPSFLLRRTPLHDHIHVALPLPHLTAPRPNTISTAPVWAKRRCMICCGKCELYAERRKSCQLPAEGAQGVALDLEALLKWATFYFDVDGEANGNGNLAADGDEAYEDEDDFCEEICSAKEKVGYSASVAVRQALMQVYKRPGANSNDAQVAL
ncbi:hypothetical protein DL764_004055 [Monosporascus ibericus]|uniref:Uncharacterized protein n=1 Tax=Monosporascus ibericus TaxID=155417 RepID=A0A4Q4TE88_9PEZI|nr:hypothetical protein DL764_004055 [Monosporascus ibericus]